MRYGMVIDLKRCIGCYACVIACKAENGTPPQVHWRRVIWHEEGTYPNARGIPIPIACNHCANPPCVYVCPTAASFQTEDGLVLVDANKCIGCRYCIMACPYNERFFIKERKPYFPEYGFTPFEEMGGNAGIDWDSKVNTVTKCTFCEHRLSRAKQTGMKPGVDREATPACVNTCIAKAMYFGDLDDPDSEINRLIAQRHGFQLRPETGLNPSVYYLPA